MLLLNKAQAEAVLNAMIALNNVNAILDANIPEGNGLGISVMQYHNGKICIKNERNFTEIYTNQNDFVKAYDLKL